MDSSKIREDFPYLNRKILDGPIIYFDNAATTQKPKHVIQTLTGYYENNCANIHRGIHTLSQESSDLYDESREKTARFIHADEKEIIFMRNATEAMNLVSYCLKGEGKILTTVMEHHSNLLPWGRQRKVEYVDIDKNGRIDMVDFMHKLDDSTVLVAITHVSNVLGMINPVEEIIEAAHKKGALCFIDGAQSVPHMPVDVKKMNCDFLAFSGHKMLAPTGIGVLYIKADHYNRLNQFMIGGSTIKEVHTEGFIAAEPPLCYEAGTPNIEGAIALGAAVDYLQDVGMKSILTHDKVLVERALEGMKSIDGIETYGSTNLENRLSVITFNVKDMGCHGVAKVLNLRENIMIRSGFHCAQPLHDRLKTGPSARASFYLYNTIEEVDTMLSLLSKVAQFI